MRRSQCSGLAPSLTWCSTAGCAMVDRSGALRVLRVTVRHFWRISALPTLVLDGLVKWMPAWSHLQFLYKLKFLQILKDHERSKRATGCARAAFSLPQRPFTSSSQDTWRLPKREAFNMGCWLARMPSESLPVRTAFCREAKAILWSEKVVSDLLVAGSVSPEIPEILWIDRHHTLRPTSRHRLGS